MVYKFRIIWKRAGRGGSRSRAGSAVRQLLGSGGSEAADAGGGGPVRAEAVAHLVAFTGCTEEQVKMCLDAANGDQERAASMLLSS
eukprot:COSAG05_NODE_2648_length_2806_cov_2.556335_2_plen_86_part_00